jgi:hypothetical protein
LVPEHLADLGQRRPGSDEFRRESVPQAVRADFGHAGSPTGTPHDAVHPAPTEWPDRGEQAQENLSMGRSRAAASQVGSDRVADIARDREATFAAALAANQHLTGSPVKVVQPERRCFARAKTETDEYEQQGEVPASLGAAPVTRSQERLCLAL